MAHHVAELVAEAEKQRDTPAGKAARARAAEAIVQLWQHRLSVESHLNPFAELKQVADTLRSLHRGANGWLNFHSGAIASVYDAFRRLVLCMAFRRIQTLADAKKSVSQTHSTRRFQSPEEILIGQTLDVWLDDEMKTTLSAPPKNAGTRAKSKSVQSAASDFLVIAQSLVGELQAALAKLADELAYSRTESKKQADRG